MKQILIFIAIAAILTTGCKKSSTPEPIPIVYPEESFLENYLTLTGFSETTMNRVNQTSYEFGHEFIPTVKGKITSFRVKLPDVNNALRVTVWDKASGAAIKTQTINVSSINTFFTLDIADIELVKDKEYCLSMNSDDWYDRRKTNNGNVAYPLTVGNIKVTSYKYALGTTQTYPTVSQFNYYAGDLSFNFQRTE